MELRRVAYFVAVAEELNFRRAAAKLHLSQSPLSQQVRKLEEEMGVALFVRSRHGVALTPAGELFLPEARRLLADAEAVRVRVRKAGEGRAGSLRVGYLTSLTNDFLAAVVRAFRAECPDVALELNDMVPEAILDGVRHRQLDVGFLRAPVRDAAVRSLEVWRDPLVVALPPGHWLQGRGAVAPRLLAEETFIMVPDAGSMGLNESIRSLCLKAGFALRRRIEVNQLQAAVWLVELGLGVALVPASLQGVRRRGVTYQPLRRPPVLPAYLVWEQANRNPAAAAFREIVRRQVRAGKK
jgi:DNA-binding transcriptional LysR family regulator